MSHDKAENGPRSAVRTGDRGGRRRVGVGRSEVKVRRLREEGAEGSREERRRGRSRREAGRSSEGPSEGPSDGRILAPWDRGTSAFVSRAGERLQIPSRSASLRGRWVLGPGVGPSGQSALELRRGTQDCGRSCDQCP